MFLKSVDRLLWPVSMAPKPAWTSTWSAGSNVRRENVKRTIVSQDGDEEQMSPRLCEPTATQYGPKEHSRACRDRWRDTKGLSVQVPAKDGLDDYQAVHATHALAASFVPERHQTMLLGRPLVVPPAAFKTTVHGIVRP